MATLAVQQIVDSGLEPSYSAAEAGGDDFVNDGSERQFIHVKDAGDGCVVTVTPSTASTTKPGFGTVTRANIAVTIGAGEDRMIGPFPLTAFGDPAITYDSETSVSLAVVRM